jgi:FlaG/FlaF family flagellin (archaellin)
MYKKSNESAVSEIIGVILIVAITVMMAAIVATLAMGTMKAVPNNPAVYVTVYETPDMSKIYVTYQGGPGQLSLHSFTIDWPSDPTQIVPSPTVGQVYVGTGTTGKSHLVVTAHYTNNVDVVVLDTMI